MFDTLSERLDQVFKTLKGQGSLSEKNMEDALREVRRALLEADVHLSVVKEFISKVREEATGQKVMKSLTPGQQVIKVVHDELVAIMGERNEQLNLAAQPPVVVMMVGLQGSGKTTTTGKLAKRLLERHQKKCLLASLDVYRPAAMEQLATVGKGAGVDVFPGRKEGDPRVIATEALDAAKRGGHDVLFLDTAGRLHVDEELMQELADVKNLVNPLEILLVADSMTGQDAVGIAKSFNERLAITGVILSKTDGDARGGAALSIRHVTGKPIKFIGTGETLAGLEPFHPDRVASRILGMGDVVSLVETAMEKVDLGETMKMQEKILSSSFTLEDFLVQMQQIKKMGPLSDLMGMIPGLKQAMKGKSLEGEADQFKRIEAIVLSMTKQERRKHQILNASRKRRIANGSGTSVQEINKLLKQFVEMQKMMKMFGKSMGKGGLKGLLGGMGMPKGLKPGALGGMKFPGG
ncbi:MAG: signal recognition particle protein [Magnetococcales bacterium]|nr:signal recognition particle protein [Magnetococcales bacterium]MBF0419958.1 signal recognition particle protein [Magnetococcales bacterium]MBF0436775.1 signal recognition particle protein [Magnetococcales bacterium]